MLMKMISLILKMKIKTLILKSKEKKEHLESHPNFKNKEDESFLKLDRNWNTQQLKRVDVLLVPSISLASILKQ